MSLVQEKFKRLVKRYPEVFRGKKFDSKEFLQVIEQTKDYGDLTVFYYDKDIIHYIVAAIVMKEGRYLDINMMSAYTLIDIYLGNIEEYTCLSVLDNEVIAIYDGAGIPNKQKGNIIAQVIDQQRMAGRKFWLFYKGSAQMLNSMYPEVMDMIKSNNFHSVVYNLSVGGSGSSSEPREEEDIF